MTYEDACRAFKFLPSLLLAVPGTQETKIAAINVRFRQRVKDIHPDAGVPETGGPTIEQLKEARTLLLRSVSDECYACNGIGHVVVLGRPSKCSMCAGTGKVLP